MTTAIKTINLDGVNCYLVKVKDGFILIDTGGCSFFNPDLPAIRNKLEKELESAGCIPGKLKLILITHGDGDHTGNAAYIREKYKTLIAMHKDDSEMVENPDMGKYLRSVQLRTLFLRILFKFLIFFMKTGLLKKASPLETFKPDLYADEGFDLAQYGFNAQILHLPGHTKGSIGILTAENDLFCGDILANINKPDLAMNALNFDELYVSVGRLKKLNVKTVYPGHGTPFPMEKLVKTKRG